MIRNRPKIVLGIAISFWVIVISAFIFCLPSPLFDDPYSTVVLDRNGELLGVQISPDGQWRFPETSEVSEKFEICITTYEDKRFYYHPGIDPIAMLRAIKQNVSSGEVVSGGATLTMQVIRLMRKGKSRNIFEKELKLYLHYALSLAILRRNSCNLCFSCALW